jgi:hypothetical protein
MEQDFTVWWGLRPKPRRCVGPTRANRLPHRSDRCGHCSAKGHAPTRFKSSRPDWFVTANPANGCESHCWRDLNFCTDVSLLAAFTPRKAPDHAGKPLEHFRPTKLGSSESLFAPGLRHVEAGVLEEDSRPVTVGFEPVDHLRIDDRAGRPGVCEPTWRFAFQHLAAHHDPVEAGLGVRRHAKRVALGRRQILRTVGYGTQPGNAAACFTQVAICTSSSSSPSWMSM